MSDFGKLGVIPKRGIKVSDDEKKVLEKLRKITRDQWKEMKPVFEELHEIAKAGGIKDFFIEPIKMYFDSMLDAILLPFIPLFEIITPEFARIFEETVPAFIEQMESLSVLVTQLLAIDFGPLGDLSDILGEVAGFLGDVISGKLQRDMMEWGQNFAYDFAMELRKALGLEPEGTLPIGFTWEDPESLFEGRPDPFERRRRVPF